jgi:hypothetical protein
MNQPLSQRVTDVRYPDLLWDFTEPHPFFYAGMHRVPESRMKVAVRPCYPHDRELVLRELEAMEAAFPIRRRPLMYLPHFDADLSTRNAATFEERLFNEPQDEHGRWATRSFIVLYGKGTPIHPAVTRYLVSHEYGHAVAEVLAWHQNDREEYRPTFFRHYAELRGLPPAPEHYGTTSWHLHPEEVFANDFRILVAQRELEFWPHPSIPRPEEVPVLSTWWAARAGEARQGRPPFSGLAAS